MTKLVCAIGLLVSLNGCCAIGAGIGAATAKDATDGAIKGAMIGGAVDLVAWSGVAELGKGFYPAGVCSPPQDDPRAVGARQ